MHQAVEENGGVPASVSLTCYATDQLQKGNVLVLEFAEELLGNALDIEGVAQTPGYFDDCHVPTRIEFADFENESAQFAEEKIARLASFEVMVARKSPSVLALHPI